MKIFLNGKESMKVQMLITLAFIFSAGVFVYYAVHRKEVPLPPLGANSGKITYINYLPTKIATGEHTVIGTLCVIGADGRNPHPVMEFDYGAAEPAWSPDGQFIAFAGSLKHPGRTNVIYVVKADGTNIHAVTDEHAGIGGPAWSPDGKKIAYYCWDPGSVSSIHIVALDSKNDQKISKSEHAETYPCWSRDGKKLLFQTEERGSNWDIAQMNVDGSDRHKITQGPQTDWLPVYSPDGAQIAFWSSRTGSWEIFIMNADGTDVKKLTSEERRTGIDISRPTWSPDGKCIAYSSCRIPGKMDILVMDMQGRELCLTADEGQHIAPNWILESKENDKAK
jgi:Tol biopolymer transport system component